MLLIKIVMANMIGIPLYELTSLSWILKTLQPLPLPLLLPLLLPLPLPFLLLLPLAQSTLIFAVSIFKKDCSYTNTATYISAAN